MKNVVIIILLSLLTGLVAAKEYREYNERAAAEMEEKRRQYWDRRSGLIDGIIYKHSGLIWKACQEINKTAIGNKWCGRVMDDKPQQIKDILTAELKALNEFNRDNPLPEWIEQ
jgi:hypothetical protein